MRAAGIEVVVYPQATPEAYDSIFPDWFTIQRSDAIPDGVLTICPMRYPSRRMERNELIIADLRKTCKHVIDFTSWESKDMYLEGKGSLIYDHRNCKIYCCLSERASLAALQAYIEELNKISLRPWRAVTLKAKDSSGRPIYHTDCVLQLLDRHALVCCSALEEPERSLIIQELTSPDKNIEPYALIDLSFEEISHMCGNVLNVINDKKERVLLISKQADENYTPEHKAQLAACYKMVASDVSSIEKNGGGSARCLLAEYF